MTLRTYRLSTIARKQHPVLDFLTPRLYPLEKLIDGFPKHTALIIAQFGIGPVYGKAMMGTYEIAFPFAHSLSSPTGHSIAEQSQ